MKTGLIISGTILAAALAVAFWPIIKTPRFWVTVGIIGGMVGVLVFSIGIGQRKDPKQ